MSGQSSKKTVVRQRELSNEVSKFLDAFVRVDEVCEGERREY